MGIFEKLQSKLELYRLEQKYARRKNRNTLSTGAIYVDGEYVFSNPSSGQLSANSTGSSGRNRIGAGMGSIGKRSSMIFGGR